MPIPRLFHLWQWFREIHVWRMIDPMTGSAMALSINDVRSWAALTDRHPTTFAVDVIARLDRCFWKVRTEPVRTAEENQSLFKQLKEKAMKQVEMGKKPKHG